MSLLPFLDSYVRVILLGCKHVIKLKKTRIVQNDIEPEFNDMLKFPASDVLGRRIRVVTFNFSTLFSSWKNS